MQIIHEERQSMHWVVNALIFSSMAIIIIYLIITWRKGTFFESPLFAQIIIIAVVVLEFFFLINFLYLKIIITREQMIFVGFGILKRKINLKDIEQMEVQKLKFNKYMGYGIRTGRDRSVGYIAKGGKGIRFKIKNHRALFITSDNPEQLKMMIKNAQKNIA